MVALWSLCLLSSFAVILGYNVRQRIVFIQRLEDRERLRLIAQAGLKKGISEIRKVNWQDMASYSLKDPLNNDAGIFSNVELGPGKFSITYEDSDTYLGKREARWGIVDEERKINLNKASLSVLRNLFQLLLNYDELSAQELASAVVDWRDADSELSTPDSAEDPYYQGLPYAYEAKDAPIVSFDELLLVRGMTPDIILKIKDYISFHSSGEVNINTASGTVLLVLGLSSNIVDSILAVRAGDDKVAGTTDDNVFDAVSQIIPKIKQYFDLGETDVGRIETVIENQHLSVKSGHFLIRCQATLYGRKSAAEASCVVDNKGKVLSWRIF